MTVRIHSEAPVGSIGEEIALDRRWLAVQRLLQSAKFNQASRLSAFLLYVTQKAIEGKPDEATEQQVGIHVFGRPPGYNPAEDNVVRSTARQLRERLALYYQEEGRNDEIKVILTRGTYLPRFEDNEPSSAATEPAVSEALPPPSPKLGWRVAAAIALLALVAGGVSWFSRNRNPLWDLLLQSPRAVLLVPGDSGTVLRQNLTGQIVGVAEYASGKFRNASQARVDDSILEDVGGRRYTSFSDLKFAARLSMLPQLNPARFSIRFARDLHVDDLKGANVILVGSPQGNPWVELFHKDLNFLIVSDEPSRTLTVQNRQPLPGELAQYTYSVADKEHRAYALLSLTRNLDRSGFVLLVQGTTVAGIEAATDFLFEEAAMRPILREAGEGGFEVLLETGNIAASGVGTAVRAKRFRPF
jgi:hypothetical protein